MTPEELNEGVARIMGTRINHFCATDEDHDPLECSHHHSHVDRAFKCRKCDAFKFASEPDWRRDQHEEFKNYAGDLNAMHEVEKSLDVVDKQEFGEHLNNIIEGGFDQDYYAGWGGTNGPFCQGIFEVAHATAEQRALAFLRTKKL